MSVGPISVHTFDDPDEGVALEAAAPSAGDGLDEVPEVVERATAEWNELVRRGWCVFSWCGRRYLVSASGEVETK